MQTKTPKRRTGEGRTTKHTSRGGWVVSTGGGGVIAAAGGDHAVAGVGARGGGIVPRRGRVVCAWCGAHVHAGRRAVGKDNRRPKGMPILDQVPNRDIEGRCIQGTIIDHMMSQIARLRTDESRPGQQGKVKRASEV